ncbi:MAG: type II secretion system protein GspM [Nitrospirota bacterium]
MKTNKTLIITIPLMVILLGLIMYNYVYLRIRTDIASLKEEQTIKTKTLEKYINLISEKPQLEKKIVSLKEARKADQSKLIEGQTPSLAAATLQDMVKEIVTANGGTISSERVEKPEDLDKFKIISVSIDTVLPDSRALSDILYSIETRTPYLTVKEVDTRVRNYRDPRELMVKLDVAAITGGK